MLQYVGVMVDYIQNLIHTTAHNYYLQVVLKVTFPTYTLAPS